MTAPERIFIRPHRIKAAELAQDQEWTDCREYHLARPGQPCSTDEFLRRVVAEPRDQRELGGRILSWVSGDFTAAMEGLE